MAIKIFRAFFGGYEANLLKLQNKGYVTIRSTRPVMSIATANQGFGKLEGTTKKLGKLYQPVPVCLFKRSTRELIWETISKSDGTYSFRNIAVGLECFVVAFDPNRHYNAVVQDNLIPFDGRYR